MTAVDEVIEDVSTPPPRRGSPALDAAAIVVIVVLSVTALKLTTKPLTTARDRRQARARSTWSLPMAGVMSTTGSTGRMQGEIPAISPATKPMTRRNGTR